MTKKPLRLACDQWISPQSALHKPASGKDLFSIQGLALIALFASLDTVCPPRRAAALGIPPFPQNQRNILFVQPQILLDWSLLAKVSTNLYVVAYARSEDAVYIHNPNDPATHTLKELGYAFGDALKNKFHPMVTRSHFSL